MRPYQRDWLYVYDSTISRKVAVGIAIEANPAFTERSAFETVSMTRMDLPTVKWQRATVLARNRLIADPTAFQAMPDPVWFTLYGGRLSNRDPSVLADQRDSKPRLQPVQINLP